MWEPHGFPLVWVLMEFITSGCCTAADWRCDCGWMLGFMRACVPFTPLSRYLLLHKDGSSSTDPNCGIVSLRWVLFLGWSANVMWTRHATHLCRDLSAHWLCRHLSPWMRTAAGRVRMHSCDPNTHGTLVGSVCLSVPFCHGYLLFLQNIFGVFFTEVLNRPIESVSWMPYCMQAL